MTTLTDTPGRAITLAEFCRLRAPMSKDTARRMIAQGVFGKRGVGWRIQNPAADRPTYLITPAGLRKYDQAA